MTKRNSLAFAALWAAVAISLFAPLNEIVTARGHKTPSSAAGNSAADGLALYDGKCALCHGKDGVGLPNWRSKGQPDFTKPEWQKAHTDEQIADAIKNGKGKFMPAFKGKLSDEETGAIVQRIRAFGKKK
jgi:mono/diheme cytochrome c family protein